MENNILYQDISFITEDNIIAYFNKIIRDIIVKSSTAKNYR